jgi:hypothetical protein
MAKLEDIDVARKMINLQQSATSRNLEYNLTFETTKRLMSYTRCYYTNVEFNDTTNIFSIDRVDPKKGYVEGNVVACTVEINSKKSNLTIDEIYSLSNQLKKFYHIEKTVDKRVITNVPIEEIVNEVVEKFEPLTWEKEPVLSKDLPKKKIRKRPVKKVVQNDTEDDFFEKLN